MRRPARGGCRNEGNGQAPPISMLAIRDQGQPSKKWAAEAEAKLRIIDRKIQDLMEVKRLLGEALARCSDQCFEVGCELKRYAP